MLFLKWNKNLNNKDRRQGGTIGWVFWLDFVSGHDLMVHGIKPQVRLYNDSTKPSSGFSLSLSLWKLRIRKKINKYKYIWRKWYTPVKKYLPLDMGSLLPVLSLWVQQLCVFVCVCVCISCVTGWAGRVSWVCCLVPDVPIMDRLKFCPLLHPQGPHIIIHSVSLQVE